MQITLFDKIITALKPIQKQYSISDDDWRKSCGAWNILLTGEKIQSNLPLPCISQAGLRYCVNAYLDVKHPNFPLREYRWLGLRYSLMCIWNVSSKLIL